MEIDINGVKITLTKQQLEEIARQTSKHKLEDINSYEDACKILNKRIRLKEEFGEYYEWYTEQIKTIIRAANYIDNDNIEWKADFNNSQESKYLPYFERKNTGWVLDRVLVSHGSSYVSVWVCFKKEKTARHIATKFSVLYNEFLG